MSNTEILLCIELTELIYSEIAYCTVLVSKRNDSCVALLVTLFHKPALVINRLLTATVQ